MTKIGTGLAAVSTALLVVIVVLLLTRLPASAGPDPIEPLCPSGSVPFGSTCAVPLDSP